MVKYFRNASIATTGANTFVNKVVKNLIHTQAQFSPVLASLAKNHCVHKNILKSMDNVQVARYNVEV